MALTSWARDRGMTSTPPGVETTTTSAMPMTATGAPPSLQTRQPEESITVADPRRWLSAGSRPDADHRAFQQPTSRQPTSQATMASQSLCSITARSSEMDEPGAVARVTREPRRRAPDHAASARAETFGAWPAI